KDGTHTLSRGQAKVKAPAQSVALRLPGTFTAGLKPGRYALSVTAKDLTWVSQPLVLGPGKGPAPFHFMHYGDYGQFYPSAGIWEAPDLAAAQAARMQKLSINLLVDRLGHGLNLNDLEWDGNSKVELDALAKRLRD